MTSWLLLFAFIFTSLPLEVFAAVDISVDNFFYKKIDLDGTTTERNIEIIGSNFTEYINGKETNVISDIVIVTSTGGFDRAKIESNGGDINISGSMIIIELPESFPSSILSIELKTIYGNNIKFNPGLATQPTVEEWKSERILYAGDPFVIEGKYFDGVDIVNIAGGDNIPDPIESTSTTIKVNSIKDSDLGGEDFKSVSLIKENIIPGASVTGQANDILTTLVVEYQKKVKVFSKLPGLDNLRVLPSFGPKEGGSLITVEALDSSNQILRDVLKSNMGIYLRDPEGDKKDIALTNIQLVKENDRSIAIKGYTPKNNPDIELYDDDNQTPKKYHVVIKELNSSNSEPTNREASKNNAYNFVNDFPNPVITSLSPSSGPDTGKTTVTIVGKNIINVNTPGILKNNSTIIAKDTVLHADTDNTLIVDYDISGNPTYSNQNNIITNIQRKIKTRIVYPATFKKTETGNPLNLEKTDILEANYGEAHFTTQGKDGIVTITPFVSNPGNQTVFLEIETLITYTDEEGDENTIIIPEGTRYDSFKYIESSPTPIISSIEPIYGFYHNVESNIKPLMLRINGSNFQALRDSDNKILYPEIRFYDSKLEQELDVEVSYNLNDIKILRDGVKIDGKDITIGNTLIISLTPKANGDLKPQVLTGSEVGGEYFKRDVRISIKNPDGREKTTDTGLFHFRHPVDSNNETTFNPHTRQPKISAVLIDGVKDKQKISSLKENLVEIRVDRESGFSEKDAKLVKVTIDGKDLTDKAIATNDGATAVIKVKVPPIFAGKTRLQVIANEGLMDSYDLIFDSLQGPEIESINPNVGVAGTFMVIKRDQTGAIFKLPDINGDTEAERLGSRVIINGQDINDVFGGYQKNPDGSVQFIDNEIFDPNPDSELLLPSKYVYVVDRDTIYLKMPESITKGIYNIQINNPDGGESSRVVNIEIKPPAAPLKIGEINPDKDGKDGGIIATIKAGEGTNFNGGIDVYIGSQKAEIIGYNLTFTEVYIKVPPLKDFTFPSNPDSEITSFSLPVTIQRTTTGASDTKIDGFTYTNQGTSRNTLVIYKDGMKATDPKANNVKSGDYIWIESSKAVFKGVLNEQGEVDKEKNPRVLIGNEVLEIDSYVIENKFQDIVEFKKIKVKVPPKPLTANDDGSVDIMVLNYDGSKETKEKGIIYLTNEPKIDEDKSVLQARRTGELVEVFAENIVNDNLIAAFGDRIYTEELQSTSTQIETNKKNELETVVVKFNPNNEKNIEVYYKKTNGELLLMEDLTILNLNTGVETNTSGMLDIGDKAGNTVVVGINWKNPIYHESTEAASNPELLKSYNKEYMYIKTIQENSNNYFEVRRGLGKVDRYKDLGADNSVISIQTPYFDDSRPTKSTITLINSDGSSATAPFEFHGGLDAPVITDLEGSKDRNVMIDGAQQKVKVKTQDYTVDGTLKVLGKNFKDVQSVKIGTKEVKVESVSQDYTYMIVSVPKGTPEEVGQPLQVTVVTKEGNAFSSRTEPPVYFMYIAADSKPIIETITPVQGPRTGGTLVSITGKGFREKDEFGKVDRITVTVNGSAPAGLKSTVKNEQGEIVELKVIMPPSVTGKAKLQVINADGGTSEPKDFTYISQPEISQTEGSIFFNDTESEVKLFGVDFQSGAKVVIGAEQTLGKKPTDAKISGMVGVTPEGINQEGYLVGGVEATGVKVTGTNQITFKMPEGIESLDNVDIIIVNPDTGMSKPKPGNIKPPVPDVPNIEAIPGFERTMILRWTVDKDVLNAAEKFEIYVRERRSGDYTFVGDTKQDTTDQSYVIKGLKYDTTYDILVRVLNKYGEAEDFGSVRETTLKQNQDYKEKEKVEAVDKAVTQIETQGKQEVIGDTLYYTVGTRESTINLSNTTAKNKTKYVQIPVRDIKVGNKTITITDKDLSLTVSYSSLNTPELRNAPDDAVFRFKISAAEKQVEESLTRAIPRAYKKASNVYGIYFELAQPKLVTPIAMLSGSATININAPAYPKYHAVYIESADTFSILQSNIITQGGN